MQHTSLTCRHEPALHDGASLFSRPASMADREVFGSMRGFPDEDDEESDDSEEEVSGSEDDGFDSPEFTGAGEAVGGPAQGKAVGIGPTDAGVSVGQRADAQLTECSDEGAVEMGGDGEAGWPVAHADVTGRRGPDGAGGRAANAELDPLAAAAARAAREHGLDTPSAAPTFVSGQFDTGSPSSLQLLPDMSPISGDAAQHDRGLASTAHGHRSNEVPTPNTAAMPRPRTGATPSSGSADSAERTDPLALAAAMAARAANQSDDEDEEEEQVAKQLHFSPHSAGAPALSPGPPYRAARGIAGAVGERTVPHGAPTPLASQQRPEGAHGASAARAEDADPLASLGRASEADSNQPRARDMPVQTELTLRQMDELLDREGQTHAAAAGGTHAQPETLSGAHADSEAVGHSVQPTGAERWGYRYPGTRSDSQASGQPGAAQRPAPFRAHGQTGAAAYAHALHTGGEQLWWHRAMAAWLPARGLTAARGAAGEAFVGLGAGMGGGAALPPWGALAEEARQRQQQHMAAESWRRLWAEQQRRMEALAAATAAAAAATAAAVRAGGGYAGGPMPSHAYELPSPRFPAPGAAAPRGYGMQHGAYGGAAGAFLGGGAARQPATFAWAGTPPPRASGRYARGQFGPSTEPQVRNVHFAPRHVLPAPAAGSPYWHSANYWRGRYFDELIRHGEAVGQKGSTHDAGAAAQQAEVAT